MCFLFERGMVAFIYFGEGLFEIPLSFLLVAPLLPFHLGFSLISLWHKTRHLFSLTISFESLLRFPCPGVLFAWLNSDKDPFRSFCLLGSFTYGNVTMCYRRRCCTPIPPLCIFLFEVPFNLPKPHIAPFRAYGRDSHCFQCNYHLMSWIVSDSKLYLAQFDRNSPQRFF